MRIDGEMQSADASIFRPRARLVAILGEHLISDQAVGLIELVKNSYDADATTVEVELLDIDDPSESKVVISDNGLGMSPQDVVDKWLSPAVDHKERSKQDQIRSSLGRLPIGEKGVGRFAAHQMGRRLKLVTRAAGKPEVALELNWDDFDDASRYLDEVEFTVVERQPEVFRDEKTGTRLEIEGSRAPWGKRLLSKVQRSLRRLQSPLEDEGRSTFKISLRCPEHPEYENIDATDVLERAHYEFRALVSADGSCDFEYECRHPAVPRPLPRMLETNCSPVSHRLGLSG
jgi:hypothetical protein